MTQLRVIFQQRNTKHILAALALTGTSTCVIHSTHPRASSESQSGDSTSKGNTSPSTHKGHVGVIESDFLDILAEKPYLNYHNPYARDSLVRSTINSGKRLWGKLARSDRNPTVVRGIEAGDKWANDSGALLGSRNKRGERPKGVPRRIRILAIDVPEFREVFDGECKVNLSRVYPDDIAPPKYIPRKSVISEDDGKRDGTSKSEEGKDTESVATAGTEKATDSGKDNIDSTQKGKKKNKREKVEKIEIMQKSLALCLVRCRNIQSKRIGVELLESSVYDLNPQNMRRAYQFGSYRYDPGEKYSNMNRNHGGDMLQRRMSVNSGIERERFLNHRSRNGGAKNVVVTKNGNSNGSVSKDENGDEKGHAAVEDFVKDGDMAEATEITEKTVVAMEEDEVDAPWNQYAWIEEMQLRIHGHIPFGANVQRASWFSRALFGNSYRRTVKSSRSFLHWFVPSFLSGEKAGGEDGIDGDYGSGKRTINRASSKPHAVIADGSAMQRVPGSLRYLTKCCMEADVPLFIINDPRVWGGNTNKDLESAARDIRKTIKARIVANALTIKEGSLFARGRMLGRLETETRWQMKDASRRTRQALTDAASRLQKERDDDWSNLDSKQLLQTLVDKKLISIEGGELLDNSTKEAFGDLCKQYFMQIERRKGRKSAEEESKESSNPSNNEESTASVEKSVNNVAEKV